MPLLGLTSTEGGRLFYVEEWPEAFETAYLEAGDRIEQARCAAQRIDFFIETGGTDGGESVESSEGEAC